MLNAEVPLDNHNTQPPSLTWRGLPAFACRQLIPQLVEPSHPVPEVLIACEGDFFELLGDLEPRLGPRRTGARDRRRSV